jgi:alanine dehydrogenase
LLLANKGWKNACKENTELKLGLNVVGGEVVYQAVADAFDLPYTDVDKFLV